MKIAFCLPEQTWLDEIKNGTLTDAAHIQQRYIAQGLHAQGHSLTYIAPHNLTHLSCTRDLAEPAIAPRTWSARPWFTITSKVAWKAQQLIGVPYLNVFTNFSRFDACLQCLPGHDIVYERNGLFNSAVAMACKRLKLPFVLFFDADQIAELDYMEQPITGLLRWRARELLRYNLKTADCIISVSTPAKTHLINRWHVPAEKVVVLPNGVNVNSFKPDTEIRSSMRTTLGLENQPVIIFVGSFHKWHDIPTLLEAFSQLLSAQRNAQLILVGDGSQREAMIHLAQELDLGQNVKFMGFLPHTEVPHLVNTADIAVVPVPRMQQDLWLSPMKLFEYMASSKGIIASAVGQLSEIIQNDTNGLLVPPGDSSAMAGALQRLVENPELRNRLGQRAREDAVRKYSWAHYLIRLEQVFDNMINKYLAN